MLLKLSDLTVTLGDKEVFVHTDFFIKGNEKIAVVGPNGSGKTTLLNIISEDILPDRDDKRKTVCYQTSRRLNIGKLSQTPFPDLTLTYKNVIDELLSEYEEYSDKRYEIETEIDKLLQGLGMDKSDRYKRLSEFSGGQLKKLAIIKLIASHPDILLLDEPTNHLDLKGTEWLEEYLSKYNGAVIIVSHDRFFLDMVTDITVEILDKKLIRYTGNYTEYKKQKSLEYERQKKAYEKYAEEVKRLTELSERFKTKPNKAAFARAKKKQMERLTPVAQPVQDSVIDVSGLEQPEYLGPKWIYESEKLIVGYEKKLLELNLRIKRGQKLAIIGENGSGKSTILKTIAGIIPKLSGKQVIGERVLMGYFDQSSGENIEDTQVLSHFHELYPGLNETDTRKKLAMWKLKGRDVYKNISMLSGGEKTKLILAEILQGRPNFLVLDEPTNHMDIPAKEVLEKILKEYTGTEIIVSHDRYFLSHVADSLLIINGEELTYYPFNYEHYIHKRKQLTSGERLAGELSAEDAALLSSVQNVPKKAPIQTRELTTEEAYKDWVMTQADERLELAISIYENRMMNMASIEEWNIAEEKLTESYLEWYDKYLEFS